MKKDKKDAFIIVRVPQVQKEALLADAEKESKIRKQKIVLSSLAREIFANYLNGR
jgi:hypothetical protein